MEATGGFGEEALQYINTLAAYSSVSRCQWPASAVRYQMKAGASAINMRWTATMVLQGIQKSLAAQLPGRVSRANMQARLRSRARAASRSWSR